MNYLLVLLKIRALLQYLQQIQDILKPFPYFLTYCNIKTSIKLQLAMGYFHTYNCLFQILSNLREKVLNVISILLTVFCTFFSLGEKISNGVTIPKILISEFSSNVFLFKTFLALLTIYDPADGNSFLQFLEAASSGAWGVQQKRLEYSRFA